jgi:hypothetical protein
VILNFIFKIAGWYPEAVRWTFVAGALDFSRSCGPQIHPLMLQKRIDDQPSISPEMVREAQGILHQHLKKVGLKQTAQRDTTRPRNCTGW